MSCTHKLSSGCHTGHASCCACNPYLTELDYCIPCSPGVFAVGEIYHRDANRGRLRRLRAQQAPSTGSVQAQVSVQGVSLPAAEATLAPVTATAHPHRRWIELYSTDQRTQMPPQPQPTTPLRQPVHASPPVVTRPAPRAGLRSVPIIVSPPVVTQPAPRAGLRSVPIIVSPPVVTQPAPSAELPSAPVLASPPVVSHAAPRAESRSTPPDHAILPPPVSLKQLAEDASVLLELFSRSSPDNEASMGAEHHTMISTAAAAICAIQARFRQMAAGNNQPLTQSYDGAREADCIICYTDSADRVFGPCHHLVVCTACCAKMGIREKNSPPLVRCPLCRTGVAETTKVFRS